MSKDLRWIHRVDNLKTRTHCWRVVVRRQGAHLTKYFSDNLFGSKEAALEAAIAYRNAFLPEISGVDYFLWRREFKRPQNTSGIVGVARYVTVSRSAKKHTEYPFWQAYWRDADGKRRSRTFMVKQYGEDGAKERACEARREGLIEVERELKNRLEKNRAAAKTDGHFYVLGYED